MQCRAEILDPCCGTGNLLKPWREVNHFLPYGIDIDKKVQPDLVADFFNLEQLPEKSYGFYLQNRWKTRHPPNLVLCNPPFNGMKPKLAPEIWLDKIIELFGKEIPIVLFCPVGFRVNLTPQSDRWQKFRNGKYPVISSIISLPKNIFPGVVFHSEVLIFNIKELEPHYFYYAPN